MVDALTAKHTYSQESQRILLPHAALGKGLTGRDWSDAWLRARDAEGLTVGNGMCLPSLRADGSGWLEVKMSSTEGQLFLHEVLGGIEQDSAPVQKLGTHSLKATLLSWAQRSPFLIFKMWERKLMGHHSLDKNKSPLTYSRQAYATLMGKVQAMFESINSGQFNPDLSAAGRVAQVAASFRAERGNGSGRAAAKASNDAEVGKVRPMITPPALPRERVRARCLMHLMSRPFQGPSSKDAGTDATHM